MQSIIYDEQSDSNFIFIFGDVSKQFTQTKLTSTRTPFILPARETDPIFKTKSDS